MRDTLLSFVSSCADSNLCLVLNIPLLCAGSLSLLRPWEVSDRNDEEAVGSIGDTGQSVVPGSKGGEDAKCPAGAGAAWAWGAVDRTQISDTQEKEGEVEHEEEEEEGNGRFQGADQEKEGEDEPALTIKLETSMRTWEREHTMR